MWRAMMEHEFRAYLERAGFTVTFRADGAMLVRREGGTKLQALPIKRGWYLTADDVRTWASVVGLTLEDFQD
jgi:hypothetical protein